MQASPVGMVRNPAADQADRSTASSTWERVASRNSTKRVAVPQRRGCAAPGTNAIAPVLAVHGDEAHAHQRKETHARLKAGETQSDIARSYKMIGQKT